MTRTLRTLVTMSLVALLAVPTNARAQALTVDGGAFRVGGEKKFLTFMSVFAALRFYREQRAAAEQFITTELVGRFDGLRIFPNWFITYDSPVQYDPNALMTTVANDPSRNIVNHVQMDIFNNQLMPFLTFMASKNMVVDLSFSLTYAGANQNVESFIVGLEHVTRELKLRGVSNVMIDIHNEISLFFNCSNLGVYNPLTDITLFRAVRAVKKTDDTRIVTMSIEPNGCGGAFATEENVSYVFNNLFQHAAFPGEAYRLDVAAYHDSRTYQGTPWYRGTGWGAGEPDSYRVERVRAGNPTTGALSMPIYFQEPDRWLAIAGTDQNSLTSLNFTEAVVRAKLAGAAAWCFHTESFFGMNRSPYQNNPVETGFVQTFKPQLDQFCWPHALVAGCRTQ